MSNIAEVFNGTVVSLKILFESHDVIGMVLCLRRFKGSECNGYLNFLFSPARAFLEAKVLTSFLSGLMVSAILLRISLLASFACVWIAHLVMFAPPSLYLK